MTSQFRNMPSVSGVLAHPRVGGLLARFSREAVVGLVRDELAAARDEVRDGGGAPSVSQVADAVALSAAARWTTWPRRVVNATGVVLHTNLGRAPLSAESLRAVEMAASGYSDLEFDLAAGKRGSRQARIADLIRQATGAEAGLAVNNNASAVTLALAAVAAGKEVVVSRGEAVEIGGGFRIPDVLAQSGARLVEVGTTNRAYARDFESAIGADTGAILSVHASNFRVIGFTHAPTLRELVEVGARHGVPVLHDLGSGCLLDTRPYGLAPEPMPQRSAADGAALGFFSGDKMLGGPQAGVIAGRREWVERAANHPLARAVRIDKLSMAALSATLLHYIHGEATEKVPIWRMISAPLDALTARAEQWREAAAGEWASVTRTRSTIGGGSLPGETQESAALRIDCAALGVSPDETMSRLRAFDPPIIGRIESDAVLLDARTVLPEQDGIVGEWLVVGG